ncbi:MAG: OmpH family outer membrane protein [Rickettsiales bacterium]|jgi:Skp family chaperone for outer membrane proteins|nr:OmpH family outer membrane protein [Rickettsiales bacterium]
MKKMLLTLLFLAGAVSAQEASPIKAGIMDGSRINEKAKVMRSINKQKDKALDGMKADIEKKRKEFEKKESELKSKQLVMSQEAFAKEAGAFQREVIDFDKQIAERDQKIKKAFVDTLKKLQEDYLDGIVRNVGKQHGFDVILYAQTIVIINKSLDVTDEIIDELDKKIQELEVKI